MRKLILLLSSACLLTAGIIQAAPRDQQVAPAAITSLTSTATRVDRTALNNRTAHIPVSWTTVNRPEGSNLIFDQLLPDGRVVNVELPRDNLWVASNGNGMAAPIPPGGDATSITLQLTLAYVDRPRGFLDQEILIIPIGNVPVPTPTIRTFTTSATTVVRSELDNKTARVPVSWQVDDRPNTANLVFEQVLANGSSVNVELPRQNPWVASSGVGVAAPVNPGSNPVTGVMLAVTLRLRVIDLATQKTLTQKDINIPISDTGPMPTIATFTTTATSVNRVTLNNKTARIPVSWSVTNRPANSNLVFEQVLDNGTVVNVELPRENPYVSSAGNGVAAPVNPGTGSVVKLQVRLVDLGNQATLAKRELSVNITEGGSVPKIAFFTTTTAVVDLAALNNKTARIPVAWSVDNRPNTANLVFEQVLGNGSSVNVELPRQNPWVASSGNGVTAPVAPGGTMTVVQLRLRLVNLADGATLDSKDITVPINGLSNAPQIVSFTANPTSATPNSQVTLSWEVRNATAISISQLPASVNASITNQMTGSTQVNIPVNASGTVTLELIARNAAGQETRATVSISIVGLPETCEFPTSLTEDCPVTQEIVNAAFQLFEKGYMAWNGSTSMIYVLFEDGHWEEYPDTWQEGDPDPIAGDMPEGLPLRGFGKVWEQIGGAPVLGFATGAEQSYQATWETHPLMDGGLTAYTPHFTLPDGRVAHLGMQWVIE